MRLSVNKGTSEARLSMVVTPLGRSLDRSKHLPMRQPGGGAPVVVGGRENRPHGEGVQDDSCMDNRSVLQSGGFQMNIEEVQRRLWEQSRAHRQDRESGTPLFRPTRTVAGFGT